MKISEGKGWTGRKDRNGREDENTLKVRKGEKKEVDEVKEK